MTLCACGCGAPAAIAKRTWAKHGWVKGQPLRFAHGHNTRTRYAPLVDRFVARIRKDQESACWLWTGTTDDKGYGQINFNGRHEKAHRVSFRLHRGSIPDGLFVCHTCDNPGCVRPDHLFLGTAADNYADSRAKGRDARGERSGHAKLAEADVRSIRESPLSNIQLASVYGLSDSMVSMIRTRRRWRHVA